MSQVRRARHRGLYWSTVLISFVAVVMGSLFVFVGFRDSAGADGAVQSYFAALTRGDAAQALAYGDIPPGPRTYLTKAVLAEQLRIAPIENVMIGATGRAGSSAGTAVQVRYELHFREGVESVSTVVAVTKHGSSWRLAAVAVPATIQLQQAASDAAILGNPVPQASVLLFPGAVPVSFDTPNLALDPASSGVQLGGSAPTNASAPVNVRVRPSATGRAAVLEALEQALARCFAKQAPAATTCPLPSGRYVPGSLNGKVTGSVGASAALTISSSSVGTINVAGTIGFTGRYQILDFNNVATTKSGNVSLPLTAVVYAAGPTTVRWAGQS